MVVDRYTKFVLTVIALLLLMIAVKDTGIMSIAYAGDYDQPIYNVLKMLVNSVDNLDLNCY